MQDNDTVITLLINFIEADQAYTKRQGDPHMRVQGEVLRLIAGAASEGHARKLSRLAKLYTMAGKSAKAKA